MSNIQLTEASGGKIKERGREEIIRQRHGLNAGVISHYTENTNHSLLHPLCNFRKIMCIKRGKQHNLLMKEWESVGINLVNNNGY